MELRIYRTFTWKLDCPRSEVIFGGPNPFRLVRHDKLQYRERPYHANQEWIDVEIFEEEKPPHPNKAKITKFDFDEADVQKLKEKLKKLDLKDL